MYLLLYVYLVYQMFKSRGIIEYFIYKVENKTSYIIFDNFK